MDRSAVVVTVFVAFAAIALWCSALLAAVPRPGQFSAEAAAWRRIFQPLIAPLLIVAAVLGWVVADPDDCESVGVTVSAIAVAAGLVILRALVRAVRAARARSPVLAGTLGLFSPTIYVSPEVRSALDERSLAALLTHERAHARHRDPARLLIAQFATDIQWPLPGARRRWLAWRQALEIARDDEALEAGVDGADLAHAIVTCARVAQRVSVGDAIAHVLGAGEMLTSRVQRLLNEPTLPRLAGACQHRWAIVIVGVPLSFFIGTTLGDAMIEGLLSALP